MVKVRRFWTFRAAGRDLGVTANTISRWVAHVGVPTVDDSFGRLIDAEGMKRLRHHQASRPPRRSVPA